MILYYFRSQIGQLDMKPPIANKQPHKTFVHGQERVDNYHWIRLSDDQKSAKNGSKINHKSMKNRGWVADAFFEGLGGHLAFGRLKAQK